MKGMKSVYNHYMRGNPYMPWYQHHPQPGHYPWNDIYMNAYTPYQGSHQATYDWGGHPFVVDIETAATANQTYRMAIWTGQYLQVTLMSIAVGDDVGLEVHPDTDQFLRIENGQGLVRMGDRKDHLPYERAVCDDDAIMVPAGQWHNLINTGSCPLKLYSIYAPPEHAYGTIHRTKQEAFESPEGY